MERVANLARVAGFLKICTSLIWRLSRLWRSEGNDSRISTIVLLHSLLRPRHDTATIISCSFHFRSCGGGKLRLNLRYDTRNLLYDWVSSRPLIFSPVIHFQNQPVLTERLHNTSTFLRRQPFCPSVAFPSSIYSNLGTSSSACNLGYLLREGLTWMMRNGYVFLFRKESQLLWLILTQRGSLVNDS